MSTPSVVLVTGANGLVGSHACAALLERGAEVRGLVRRAGTAPDGVTEVVGDFADPDDAARAVEGVDVVVTTVHPMGSDLDTQRTVGVQGTATMARAAAEAGVGRLVHVSTAAVIDRHPGAGDVNESSPLVSDDAGDYPLTKRETEEALAEVGGLTRLLLRPPVIMGPSESSVWNTLRPAQLREDASAREANPDGSFAWVHVTDLARIIAMLADGTIADAADPSSGPVSGTCAPLVVAAGPAHARDYYGTVADALGVDMTWTDEPAWTGRVVADRARSWGWTPQVTLEEAMDELRAGIVE